MDWHNFKNWTLEEKIIIGGITFGVVVPLAVFVMLCALPLVWSIITLPFQLL